MQEDFHVLVIIRFFLFDRLLADSAKHILFLPFEKMIQLSFFNYVLGIEDIFFFQNEAAGAFLPILLDRIFTAGASLHNNSLAEPI